MQQTERKQEARQSSGWIWQAVTGVLLIVIVLLHMIFHHFEEGLLSASQVVGHVADPAIFILEILFILVVTYHALLGIKAVIFDLQLSDSARQKVSRGLAAVHTQITPFCIMQWLPSLIFDNPTGVGESMTSIFARRRCCSTSIFRILRHCESK